MVIARFTALVAAMVFLIALPAVVLAQAAPPHAFFGSATVEGIPAPDGTVITAWIDDSQVASTTMSEGRYTVVVVEPEGVHYPGETVSFKVGDVEADQTAVWEQGGVNQLNLTASTVQAPQVDTEAGPGESSQDGEAAGAGEPGQDGEAAGAGEPGQGDVDAGSGEPDQGDMDAGAGGPGQGGEDTDAGKARRAFAGVVDGEPAAAVTLIRKGSGQRVTVRLDSYRVRTPGGPVAGTFTDGANVVILARRDGAEWAALWVLVKPTGPSAQPVTGAVVSVQDGVLTIMRSNGTTKTVQLGRGVAPPEVGELVTGFAGPAADGDAQSREGHPVTKGLVRASEVRRRLEGFLNDLTAADGSLPEEATGHRARLVDDVAVILEGHADERVSILEKLSGRNLPAQAVEGMQRALEKTKLDRGQARANAAEARNRAGPPPGRGQGAAAGQGNSRGQGSR
tara:strand:- start:200 stop:1558 length:1359 start_codon:yes stop_codon:yes gene_type:complete